MRYINPRYLLTYFLTNPLQRVTVIANEVTNSSPSDAVQLLLRWTATIMKLSLERHLYC